jgi:hypothetical protein
MNAGEQVRQDEGPCILVVSGRKFSEGVKNSNKKMLPIFSAQNIFS